MNEVEEKSMKVGFKLMTLNRRIAQQIPILDDIPHKYLAEIEVIGYIPYRSIPGIDWDIILIKVGDKPYFIKSHTYEFYQVNCKNPAYKKEPYNIPDLNWMKLGDLRNLKRIYIP